MSKQTNDTQKALRELTGGSNSEIRQLRKNLAGFASVVLAQQAARPVEQYNPPRIVTSEANLSAKPFVDSEAKSSKEASGNTILVRICVNGSARDQLFVVP